MAAKKRTNHKAVSTDALFPDGDISQMRFGEDLGRRSNRFGSVIAVVE